MIFIAKLYTYFRLGLRNLFWVYTYRRKLKNGYFPRILPIESSIEGPFFYPSKLDNKFAAVESPWLHGELVLFDKAVMTDDQIPDWHKFYLSDKYFEKGNIHWSKIPDFEYGDIKEIWELSRFNWLLKLAQAYASTGDDKWLNKLNLWLENWSEMNPANCGPNWKCGQEASIRVMHLITASFILNQHNKCEKSLVCLIEQHLKRIKPTLTYAMAQNNNHGTSEAAALFIGAMFLKQNNSDLKDIHVYLNLGRSWLENRMGLLIMDDGNFSQYSINYHRLLLDTLSLVEFFRDVFQEETFSDSFYQKAEKSCLWLAAMTDESSGDAPNLGANDGARLIPLTQTEYRDYRPSVQLSSVLFRNKKIYNNCDEILNCFNLKCEDLEYHTKSINYKNGGYALLKSQKSMALIKYPVYKFRPSHADALHVDFWLKGQNILRDGGTYSYNTDKNTSDYFSGVKSHNTIEFDYHDQMPKLSRFLYGSWLKTQTAEFNSDKSFTAFYKGNYGELHLRRVELQEKKLIIEDEISGFKESAVLRWRLIPGKWTLTNNQIESESISISVSGSMKFNRLELVSGEESRFYLEKTTLPVLEVEVNTAGNLITEVKWE